MNEQLFNKSLELDAERSLEDGEIVAYLTTWNNPDVVGDVMAKGCTDAWLKSFSEDEESKLPMLHGHSSMDIVGEWTAFEADEYGLKGKGILYTEMTSASDIHKLIKRGMLASVSIGFRSSDYEYLEEGGRLFKAIELVETSVVLNPANDKAKILSVKSEDGLIDVKSLKSMLRDGGLNRKEIDALFNGGFSELKHLRNAEAEAEIAAQKEQNKLDFLSSVLAHIKP